MQTARSILPELVSGRGTTRRVVEGQASEGFCHDMTKHDLHILQNFNSRNPQRLDPRRRQPVIATRVPRRPITARMCLAVHLDRQPCIAAEEVQNVRPARMLTPKLEAAGTLPKLLPEDHFR